MGKNSDYIRKTLKKGLNEFKIGTKTMFKEFFNKETNKKQRANMWTFSRLIIPLITLICSICAIAVASPTLFITTGIIAGLGAVTDYFDGRSSRKHGSASAYGKLLDQISDKIFTGIIGINLTFINPTYIMVLLGEMIIAAINIGYKLKYNNLDITSTKTGKLKEWPLFITLALGFFSPISPIFFKIANVSTAIVFAFQIATAGSYIIANDKEVKKLKIKEIQNFIKDLDEKSDEEVTKEKELILNKENGKLEQLNNLRSVLKQYEYQKQEENINNIQKTKKL